MFKVEQRKPKSALIMCRNWIVSAGTDECHTNDEAVTEVARLVAYDSYYHCDGWEYRIVEFTPKKR